MDVSIIIINYKSAKLVLDCIESIYRQQCTQSFEVIVVDNHSEDNCQEALMKKFPAVKWLPLTYNAGFARANNAGISLATGRYVLLLNADTIILENAIDKSIRLLEKHNDAVGCGVQLLNPDGSQQISGAHFITGGLNTLLPLPYFGRLVRYLGYRFKSKIPSVQNVLEDMEVDWIVGAFMLVKKEAVQKAGLLDNDFFMYAEEIEWCGRLRKFGKLYLFSEPKVIHIGGGTSSDYYGTDENENGKNLWNRKGRQIIVSTMLRIRKQFGPFWYLFNLGCYVLEVPVFFICLFIEKIFSVGKSRYTWKDAFQYTLNMITLLRYFPRMLFNKPYFYKVA